MKHYDSIPRIQDDGTLSGEVVWGFNKLDGQNFCVTYKPKRMEFGPYGSRNVTVDENSEQFGPTVKWFDNSGYKEKLNNVVRTHMGKKEVFNGIEEVTFFFEWYGENSLRESTLKVMKCILHLLIYSLRRKDTWNQRITITYSKIQVLNFLN